MKVYLVGGAVRDGLLGLPVSERDWVVTGASPQEMLAQGYRPVGRDFPVFLHPETREEYALARTERKSGHGYTGFEFHSAPGVTLAEDLTRRDLTINAIARAQDGHLIDPFNGQRDIAGRWLRHVSPAFVEDPVRILRTARFAARFHHLGFRIADETRALMREMVAAGETRHLVPERVWQETSRALTGKDPAVFFEVLRECGALADIMPELDALFGVPQNPEYHPEIDTGLHTLLALTRAAELTRTEARTDPANETRGLEVHFATLVHDLGKGLTPEVELPAHRGHEQRGLPAVKTLCERLGVPRQCRDLALLVCQWHLHAHRALELKPATLVRLFEQTDAFRRPDRFNQFLLCCEADARGRTGLEDRPYPQRAYLAAMLEASSSVEAAPFVEAGLRGPEVAEAIRRERILRCADLRSRASDDRDQ